METEYGFPVVNANNIFEVLESLGVVKVEHTRPTTTLDEYLREDLNDFQLSELRFTPKVEVVHLADHTGKAFAGFRTVARDWATVFAMLPNRLVVVVGEYKLGADEVVVVPPSGVPNRQEMSSENPLELAAKREWEEETGLKLAYVSALTDEPLIISGRNSTVRYRPYFGELSYPIEKGPSKLDDTENLKIVLVPLDEWLKILKRGKGVEEAGIGTTFFALKMMAYF